MAPHILKLCARKINFKPRARKRQLNSSQGGPQNWTEIFEEEKNLYSILGTEERFIGWPPRSLVAEPTELSRLEAGVFR
jgi:hypothetical protein